MVNRYRNGLVVNSQKGAQRGGIESRPQDGPLGADRILLTDARQELVGQTSALDYPGDVHGLHGRGKLPTATGDLRQDGHKGREGQYQPLELNADQAPHGVPYRPLM